MACICDVRLTPKADIRRCKTNVGLVPIADIAPTRHLRRFCTCGWSAKSQNDCREVLAPTRGQSIRTMWVLEAILLVVLPYGTAIICGAITEGAGRLVSGYCSLGGLALGIYFFSKCMEVLAGG